MSANRKLCRFCAEIVNSARNLYDNDYDNMQYISKFKQLFSDIVFEEDDYSLPEYICSNCCTKLKDAYSFKKQCIFFMEYLKKCIRNFEEGKPENYNLKNIDIKQEENSNEKLTENSSENIECDISTDTIILRNRTKTENVGKCKETRNKFAEIQMAAISREDESVTAVFQNEACVDPLLDTVIVKKENSEKLEKEIDTGMFSDYWGVIKSEEIVIKEEILGVTEEEENNAVDVGHGSSTADLEQESDVNIKASDPKRTRNRKQIEIMPEDELEKSGNSRKVNAKEKNKRVKRKLKHYCKFCNLEVYDFARHLLRLHYDEFEVQKFWHLETKNPLRKQLIDKIRKQGDFIQGTLVPVQDKHRGHTNKNDILSCIHCKGYYLKSNLRRHTKRCYFNNGVRILFLPQNFGPNDPLRIRGVLNSLQADTVSLVAKKDKIICELARRYLKCHRDKQLLTVVKRYMRRLARLLIKVRKIENNSELTLLCILHPSKFKSLISATKFIGQYDANTGTYNSPSLPVEMKTLLKKAIDAAYSLVLNKDINSPLLNLLNITKKIIRDDWSREISTQPGQNLQVKKFNKPTLIPVTEDLVKMKTYLDNLVATSKSILNNNNKSEKAYRELIESTYCNLLLFNRRRVVELQRIPLETYTKHINTTSTVEFEKLLTPSEKVLISNIKRVVIKGKRGRGLPVLFDNSTQESIETAIKHRKNFFENIDNVYLFGLSNMENPISGYHVFRKHVTKALGDPQKTIALTSTKFRKHLAIIYQILNMKDGDLEQLALFMGHTMETYSEWHRLPSDIYQTAKVSKLLLICQRNEFDKYNLDQIEVDNEVEEDGVENGCDIDEDANVGHHKYQKTNSKRNESELTATSQCKKKQKILRKVWSKEERNESELTGTSQCKKKQKILRKVWSKEEKQVTEEYFMKNIRNKITPKKEEVMELIEKHPKLFKGRTWNKIKAYVYNKYSKN